MQERNTGRGEREFDGDIAQVGKKIALLWYGRGGLAIV